MTLEKLKKDLRELRHINYTVLVLLDAEKRLRKQIEFLKKIGSNGTEIRKIAKAIDKLGIECEIAKSNSINEMYAESIGRLEQRDKVLVVAKYYNCQSYYQIAHKMGYSEDYLRCKIMPKVMNKLFAILKRGNKR